MNQGKLELARRNTQESILATMEDGGWTVNCAPPNSGKTFGFLKNLSQEQFEGALFQPNHELRDETILEADGLDLSTRDLPSFPDMSPLMDEHSDSYDERAEDWYNRGMYPRQIICRLGSEDDDPYLEALDEKWDEDVLVGDPVHSFLTRPVTDRHVAFDDANIGGRFLSEHDVTSDKVGMEIREYLTTYKNQIAHLAEAEAVNEPIPRSFSELQSASSEMKHVIYLFVCDNPAADIIDETMFVRAETSDVIRVIVTSGNRAVWDESDPFVDGGVINVGVFYQPLDVVLLFRVPKSLQEAKSVHVLSATPELPILELFFNQLTTTYDVLQPLPEDLLQHYFDEILNMQIIRTTDKFKPISGDNRRGAIVELDSRVQAYIAKYDAVPLVVSSKKLIDRIKRQPRAMLEELSGIRQVLEADKFIHFAKAIGTNQFENIRHGIVYGSPHYGDGYVRKMSALAGDMHAEPIREKRKPTRWSTETSESIYQRMTAGSVLQALLRIGRSTRKKSTVWIETTAIPDYVPHEYYKVANVTESEKAVLDFVDEDEVSIAEIAEATGFTRSRIYDVVDQLIDLGLLEAGGPIKWNAQTVKSNSHMLESFEELGLEVSIQLVQSFGFVNPDFTDTPGTFADRIAERVKARSDVTVSDGHTYVQDTLPAD